MARLEVQSITAGYGDTVVLRDLDLVVPSGSVVALLGPNGAGKTTLLSSISGLVRITRGDITLDGQSLSPFVPDEIVDRGVCHITEGRSIFPGLSVRDNLRMFARAGQEAEAFERVTAAFPRLGERINQVAGTLSGGEQQMLALSRAYVRQPKVVLLDEISLGLAPLVVGQIFEFLAAMAADGTTLLVVEQYVAKALAIADHVYLISRGRIVYAGEPAEIEGSEVFSRYLGDEASLLA
jgi:branched-chain amino acid transport system ATP-binding protein